jgi:hypothetical protein
VPVEVVDATAQAQLSVLQVKATRSSGITLRAAATSAHRARSPGSARDALESAREVRSRHTSVWWCTPPVDRAAGGLGAARFGRERVSPE